MEKLYLRLETKDMADYKLLESCRTVSKTKEVLGIDSVGDLLPAFDIAAAQVLELFKLRAETTFDLYYKNLSLVKVNQKTGAYYKTSGIALLRKVDSYGLFSKYASGGLRFKSGSGFNLSKVGEEALREELNLAFKCTYEEYSRNLKFARNSLERMCFEATDSRILKSKKVQALLGFGDYVACEETRKGNLLKDALLRLYTEEELYAFMDQYELLGSSRWHRSYQYDQDEKELDALLDLLMSLDSDLLKVEKAQEELAKSYLSKVSALSTLGKLKPAERSEDGWVLLDKRKEYMR